MRMSRRMAITSPWSGKVYGSSFGAIKGSEIESVGFTTLQTDICYDPAMNFIYMAVLYRRGTSTSAPPDIGVYAVAPDNTTYQISSLRGYWTDNSLLPQTKAISSIQLGAFYRATSSGSSLPSGYCIRINFTFSDGVQGIQEIQCFASAASTFSWNVKSRMKLDFTTFNDSDYSMIAPLYRGSRWVYSVSGNTVVLSGVGDGYTSNISTTLTASGSIIHLYTAGRIAASSGQGLLVLSNDDYVTWRDAYLPDSAGWVTPIKYSNTNIFRAYSSSYDSNTKQLVLACNSGIVVIDTVTKAVTRWEDTSKHLWHVFNAPTGIFTQDVTNNYWYSSMKIDPPGDLIRSIGTQKLSINKSICDSYNNDRIVFIWFYTGQGPYLMEAGPSQRKAW